LVMLSSLKMLSRGISLITCAAGLLEVMVSWTTFSLCAGPFDSFISQNENNLALATEAKLGICFRLRYIYIVMTSNYLTSALPHCLS
jgi:hypothetical protein